MSKLEKYYYKPVSHFRKGGKHKPAFFFIPRLFIIGLISIILIFIYFSKDLPNPRKLDQRQSIESTKIYDRTGEIILYDIHGEEKRTVISLDQINNYLIKATLAAEDANFYQHPGIDIKAVVRALIANLKRQQFAQGGSTITQQFIKSSFLTSEKTITRKIKELILSLELELKYSKDEILAFYLNQVPYGSNAYGIEAASLTFLNKHAKDLSLAESALLASLTKAPTYYSPFGSHPEELKRRQEYVLNRMTQLGFINYEEAEMAKKEKLIFNKAAASLKAPHFVMFIKEYLENKYGQEVIEKGGLKVMTTLDWDLQQLAEKIINEGAKDNEKNFKSYNAALVALDPKTGQILAMVGSRDFFGESLPIGCTPGQNCKFDPSVNVTIRDRQPGSSFKPFAYAAVFKRGYTPDTMLFDLETEFGTGESQSYKPQNYDGKFRGPVSIRQSLAQSLNVTSVKVLYLAGIDETIKLSQEMGITTLKDKNRYGLSLVLGGGEVKLLDEAAAYGVFATDGIRHPKTAILKIENNRGKTLEEFKNEPLSILEPQIARLINDILSDNKTRAPIFGENSPLYLGERLAAVKTGTTQEYRDAWTIGYTPSLVVGVWAGNNDNSPMVKAGAGLYAAAPLWNKFIKRAYELKIVGSQENNEFILPKEPESFIPADTINANKFILNGHFENERKIKIDKVSGKLSTDSTPPQLIEEKIYKEIHSILYYVEKNNPQSDPPANPANDPQFFNWELPILEWAKSLPFVNQPLPPASNDSYTNVNPLSLTVIYPQKNTIIRDKTIKIKLETIIPSGVKQIDLFLDGEFIMTSHQTDLIDFVIPSLIKPGTHLLKVKIYDNNFNYKEEEIPLFINL